MNVKLEILSTESSAGCHQLLSHTVDMHQMAPEFTSEKFFFRRWCTE